MPDLIRHVWVTLITPYSEERIIFFSSYHRRVVRANELGHQYGKLLQTYSLRMYTVRRFTITTCVKHAELNLPSPDDS